jgi:hypothetical protein
VEGTDGGEVLQLGRRRLIITSFLEVDEDERKMTQTRSA